MRIAVLAETDRSEPRVAATPETVKKLLGLGAEVAVQAGAGAASGFADADYAAAGASIAANAKDTVAGADVVLRVRRPSPRMSREPIPARPSSRSWILMARRAPSPRSPSRM